MTKIAFLENSQKTGTKRCDIATKAILKTKEKRHVKMKTLDRTLVTKKKERTNEKLVPDMNACINRIAQKAVDFRNGMIDIVDRNRNRARVQKGTDYIPNAVYFYALLLFFALKR